MPTLGPLEFIGGLLDPEGWLRGGGQLAFRDGAPVLWAGVDKGWQSPETFAKLVPPEVFERLTGAKSPAEIHARASRLEGYDPDRARRRAQMEAAASRPPAARGSDGIGTVTPGSVPPTPPELPPPPASTVPPATLPNADATIPQTTDPTITALLDLYRERTDPEHLRALEDQRAKRLFEGQLLTSELSKAREADRYANREQIKNIEAWQALRTEQIRANALREAAAATAMISAFTPPNAEALSNTLNAAMAPYSNMKLS